MAEKESESGVKIHLSMRYQYDLSLCRLVLWLSLFAMAGLLLSCGDGVDSPEGKSLNTKDFGRLIGQWQRTDGGYIIDIEEIRPDGRTQASYYNPQPINVSAAETSMKGEAIRIMIELRDAGYPGSYYDLTYDPEGDRLFGEYFQATMRETYPVEFVRARF